MPLQKLREARQLLEDSLRRLQVPLLSSGERLQMPRAGLRGVTQFLRQVDLALSGKNPWVARLGLAPGFTGSMAEVQGQLVRIVGQAQELLGHGEREERQAVVELKETLERLVAVAEELSNEEAVPQEERQQAARFVAFVRGYRQRTAEQAAAPKARVRRKVARAAAEAEGLRGRQVMREMTAELLGQELPEPLLTARPLPERRRRSDDEVSVLGAPLEECLGAEPAEYGRAADGLDQILGELGPVESEAVKGEQKIDVLLETDLSILVLRLLGGLPGLSAEAGTSDGELAELLDRQHAAGQMRRAAALLLCGARDGALTAAQLVLLVHEQALALLAGQDDSEARALRQDLVAAEAVLLRSQEEKDAVLHRADRRIAEIEGEGEAQLAFEAYQDTVAQVAEGKAVDPTRLHDAVAFKRETESVPLAARKKSRSRKR